MKHPPKTNKRTPFRAPASAAPAARGEAAPESAPPAPVRTRRGKPATGRANRGQVGRDGKQVITAKPERLAQSAGCGRCCLRREMEAWIAEGKVSVNGENGHARAERGADRQDQGGRPADQHPVPPATTVCRVCFYHKPGGDCLARRPGWSSLRFFRFAAFARRTLDQLLVASISTPPACCYSPTPASWLTS